jgi:hypothetical protein
MLILPSPTLHRRMASDSRSQGRVNMTAGLMNTRLRQLSRDLPLSAHISKCISALCTLVVGTAEPLVQLWAPKTL